MHIEAQYAKPQLARKSIPNPRGTQTVPQPRPVTPRAPDGRFTSPLPQVNPKGRA